MRRASHAPPRAPDRLPPDRPGRECQRGEEHAHPCRGACDGVEAQIARPEHGNRCDEENEEGEVGGDRRRHVDVEKPLHFALDRLAGGDHDGADEHREHRRAGKRRQQLPAGVVERLRPRPAAAEPAAAQARPRARLVDGAGARGHWSATNGNSSALPSALHALKTASSSSQGAPPVGRSSAPPVARTAAISRAAPAAAARAPGSAPRANGPGFRASRAGS